MVRFTLFGVPVEIQPWFWATSAMLGGALRANTPEGFQQVVLFMFAATISILVHEYGHALVGRRLGGGYARIVLWAFGGLAYNEGGRFTKWQNFWRVAAGPGAGFAFLLVLVAVLSVFFGPRDSLALAGSTLFGTRGLLSLETLTYFQSHLPLYSLIHSFLWINFWWGMLNLVPVLPLDGGRIAELFVRPQSRVYQLAIAASVAVALLAGLMRGDFYLAAMFGFLAWRNYQSLQGLWGR